jgi:hypothetical protein
VALTIFGQPKIEAFFSQALAEPYSQGLRSFRRITLIF